MEGEAQKESLVVHTGETEETGGKWILHCALWGAHTPSHLSTTCRHLHCAVSMAEGATQSPPAAGVPEKSEPLNSFFSDSSETAEH